MFLAGDAKMQGFHQQGRLGNHRQRRVTLDKQIGHMKVADIGIRSTLLNRLQCTVRIDKESRCDIGIVQLDQLLGQKAFFDGNAGGLQPAHIPKQGAVLAHHHHGRRSVVRQAIGDTLTHLRIKCIEQDIQLATAGIGIHGFPVRVNLPGNPVVKLFGYFLHQFNTESSGDLAVPLLEWSPSASQYAHFNRWYRMYLRRKYGRRQGKNSDNNYESFD